MAYLKPSMFRRTGKFLADTVKWASLNTMKGARSIPGGMSSFAGGVKSASSKIGMGAVDTVKYIRQNPTNSFKYGMKYGVGYGIGGGVALGAVAMGIGSSFAKGTTGIVNRTMRGILPNTQYPAASGMFGTRTSAQAGPAGIEGLKFNFRRR